MAAAVLGRDGKTVEKVTMAKRKPEQNLSRRIASTINRAAEAGGKLRQTEYLAKPTHSHAMERRKMADEFRKEALLLHSLIYTATEADL